MMPFLKSLFSSERRFSSYDECPEIYYRLNGRGEYGPQKLDRVIAFSDSNPDITEARFADEKRWRPQEYFKKLWQHIPLGVHTIKRLTNEGIPFDSSITEFKGRQLLRDQQRIKPPTAAQLKRIQSSGVSVQGITSRAEAKAIITQQETILRKENEKAAQERQRLQEAPQIVLCRERLSLVSEQVNHILHDWAPKDFEDLDALSQYTDLVEESLEYATTFDSNKLLGDPFYDPSKSDDYYLEFASDPNEEELRVFQGNLFVSYLKAGGDHFDHLILLKKAFPSVKISPL